MHVTVLWTHDAAQAHGSETTWTNIASVEATPQELRLHASDDSPPVVIDRTHVVAYNRTHMEATE